MMSRFWEKVWVIKNRLSKSVSNFLIFSCQYKLAVANLVKFVQVEYKKINIDDLNDLAGQSSVYLWFFGKTGSQFRSDMCIDDVSVVGEE